MHPLYLDEARVRRYFERSSDVFGVTDAGGVLRAYICVRVCGEVACVEPHSRPRRRPQVGVMWVLVTGTIRDLVERKQTRGCPTWFIYDMFLGASPGLRQFKPWSALCRTGSRGRVGSLKA
jgi:hypothetical protein